MVQYNSFQANGWLDDLDTKLKKIKHYYGDIRDKDFLINVCKNHDDAILHLAALIATIFLYQSLVTDKYKWNILDAANK